MPSMSKEENVGMLAQMPQPTHVLLLLMIFHNETKNHYFALTMLKPTLHIFISTIFHHQNLIPLCKEPLPKTPTIVSLKRPQWPIISWTIQCPKHTTNYVQFYIRSYPCIFVQFIRNHILGVASTY